MLHVVGVYWWYRNDDLLYPLAMLPPKAIPPFWHAIFIILVNGMLTVYYYSFSVNKIVMLLSSIYSRLLSITSFTGECVMNVKTEFQ